MDRFFCRPKMNIFINLVNPKSLSMKSNHSVYCDEEKRKQTLT